MDRGAVLALMARRYAEAYQASPDLSYPEFRAQKCNGKATAALGYRRADAGPLFLETYLDLPVEQALESALGRTISRRDIVEIGNLASENAPAMVALWAKTANDLGDDAEIAVAVLTTPLREMFRRLGVTLHEIEPARANRIGDAASSWGDYYDQNPIICAGLIADGQDRLSRFAERLLRRCA
jgi:Thermostable hemolysin